MIVKNIISSFINWKSVFLFCCMTVLIPIKGFPQQGNSKKPNIVFFFADDLGYGDIRVNNPASKIPTPNIDKLASQGMRFTDAHCVGALCAPSRFGLITGRDAANWQHYVNIESEAWNCKTMPQMLKEEGYYTSIVGKWHFGVLFKGKDGRWGAPNPISGKFPKPKNNWKLSSPTRLGPLDRGFDYFFGTPLQPGGGWYANMEGRTLIGNVKLSPNLPKSDEFVHQDWMKQITGKAKEQIEVGTSKKEPFFLYFPINSPHKPIIPDKEFRGITGIGEYGDYVNQVDWCVGEILKAVDEAGIADNTIFIFASDNGSYYYPGSRNNSQEDEEELKENHHKANGVFKSGKGNPEEGGHRIPYIVRWPGHIKAGSISTQLISLADHFATFAAITGYELKQEEALDSWNILPVWEGEIPDSDMKNRTLFHFNRNPDVIAVRQGKWKMIPESYYKTKKKGKKSKKSKKIQLPGQLYDLSTDPGETNNVYELHPDIVDDLKNKLNVYRKTKHNSPHIQSIVK